MTLQKLKQILTLDHKVLNVSVNELFKLHLIYKYLYLTCQTTKF